MFLETDRRSECPKCGETWNWTRLHNEVEPHFRSHPDRLEYHCPRCGYVQRVECRDRARPASQEAPQ